MLRCALEAFAQLGVLRGDADRAGVEMALAHHDATGRDQRRGGKAELIGTQQRPDHHVAARAHAAIDLHGDAASQSIGDQCLVRFGQSDLPRRSCVLDGGQRRGTRTALNPAIVTWSARALATPAATVPTPTSETSFTDTSPRGLTFLRSKMSWARSSME